MSAGPARPENEVRICVAIKRGDLQAVKDLLEKYPQFLNGFKSDSPMHVAAEYNRSDVIELLFLMGASIDPLDPFERTPMHCAVERNSLSAIKTLCMLGSKAARMKNRSGNTPFHSTICHCNADVVEALVQLGGGDINVVDSQGKTLLDCVIRKQATTLLKEEIPRLQSFEDSIKFMGGKRASSRGEL